MTLQDASNIAQVASALLVMVSLIYVGLEIRQNSSELRISTLQAQADAATGYLIPLGLDPMLRQIMLQGMDGKAPDLVDATRLTLIMNGVFAQFQAGWEAAQGAGRTLRPWWAYQERALASWLAAPQVQGWWATDRLLFADGFRELVDGKLAALSPPTSDPAPPPDAGQADPLAGRDGPV